MHLLKVSTYPQYLLPICFSHLYFVTSRSCFKFSYEVVYSHSYKVLFSIFSPVREQLVRLLVLYINYSFQSAGITDKSWDTGIPFQK